MTDPREDLERCRAEYRRLRESVRRTVEQIVTDAREISGEINAADAMADTDVEAVPEALDDDEEISEVHHLTRAEQALDEALAATSGVRRRAAIRSGG